MVILFIVAENSQGNMTGHDKRIIVILYELFHILLNKEYTNLNFEYKAHKLKVMNSRKI